jgi:hypothetical protein
MVMSYVSCHAISGICTVYNVMLLLYFWIQCIHRFTQGLFGRKNCSRQAHAPQVFSLFMAGMHFNLGPFIVVASI